MLKALESIVISVILEYVNVRLSRDSAHTHFEWDEIVDVLESLFYEKTSEKQLDGWNPSGLAS